MRFISGIIVGIIWTLYIIYTEQEMRLKYIPDSWKSTVRNTLNDRNK